jgi:hypothetical protein
MPRRWKQKIARGGEGAAIRNMAASGFSRAPAGKGMGSYDWRIIGKGGI